LIRHRDGIVGTWQGATLDPRERRIEDPANMAAWDASIRAYVIDFDLLSHLHFTKHSETFSYKNGTGKSEKASSRDSVTVWHLHVTDSGPGQSPRATSSPVATFIRPPPQTFKEQIKYIDQYSDLREDRATEIISQLTDPYQFWGSVVYLHPERTRKTIELLNAALRLASYVEMRVKHALACRRAVEYSPQTQPVILTPGHGTLPSGHATENHMIARVLWELRGGKAGDVLGEELMRQAARIAVNRTVAGVHFPVDTAAGQMLGLTLARYFISRATGRKAFGAWRFDGRRWNPKHDFDRREHYDTDKAEQRETPYAHAVRTQPPEPSPILRWMWDEAEKEWP
jgi:hypothetical protein